MLPHHLLLLCGFLALCTAGPLKHFHHSSSGEQRLLRDPMQHAPMVKPKPKTHLDAAPNSVGVLFTTSDDEEVLHIWLPLGERVYTRDSPELPLHPLTARITTMIHSTPQKATPEHLDRVVCQIHPAYNKTMDNQKPEAMSISITKSDELVRLADADVKRWREVEAYECS